MKSICKVLALCLCFGLVISMCSCSGGGGGGGLSSLLGNKDDKATKDNFAGKQFGDNGMWDGSNATIFIFGNDGTVKVKLAGGAEKSCTYNKPTGLKGVTLEIKDGGSVIFNQSVDFDDAAHSFNTKNKAGNATITFSVF